MKNVLKPLAKSVLTPLGITAVALARYVAIQKKTLQSCMVTVIISNEKINDIMKIVNLEESGLLIQDVSETNKVSETIKNEAKKQKQKQKQKEVFLGMLLSTLSTTLLGNILTGKRAITAGEGKLEQPRTFNAVSSFK